ncbi:MAG: nucleotide pyrophosphohydrolase [Gammaproteobacteria bacterium]|nr:nucleotide pyrophosphohydrolase [Gammaproteobacteria bacterium]
MTTPDHADRAALADLRERLRAFAAARDWEQFHTPKNLAMALACEAAEVMEHFLWLDGATSAALTDAKRAEVGEELADVLIYLVRLADKLDIDLLDAANAKIARNAERYPADRVRGRAVKYSELEDEPGGADGA